MPAPPAPYQASPLPPPTPPPPSPLPPSLANSDFKVDFTVKPISAVGVKPIVISNPNDSGCGSGNDKCHCKLSSAGELLMIGAGSDGTATGLDFACLFNVGATKCFVRINIPFIGDSTLRCVCAGYSFIGCEVPTGGHDFTKTIALVGNELLDPFEGDFKVDFAVMPISAAGYKPIVISNPTFEYGGSGCGHDNDKCHCKLSSAGELLMIGAGSDGTATGLTFACLFNVGAAKCRVKIDIPWLVFDDNSITCECADYSTFIGCEVPTTGHDFTKTIALVGNEHLDEPRCEPLPPSPPPPPPSPSPPPPSPSPPSSPSPWLWLR